jgi:hypothetical protein
MDTHKKIAKALVNKSFAEAKELIFKSLYAKASLALDEARFAVANAVFNEAKTAPDTGVPAGASKDKMKAARDTVKKAGYKAKLGKGVPAGAMKEEAELDEMAQTAAREKQWSGQLRKTEKQLSKDSTPSLRRKHEKLFLKGMGERHSKKLYGKNGKPVKKSVKEATEQLDEVSPPDMEKMTGSKKTKASFTKQYGKRGKSVMYATAWKLHNKKAGKD